MINEISDHKMQHSLMGIAPVASAVVEGGTDVEIQTAIDGLTAGRTFQEKIILRGDFLIDDSIVVPSNTYIEIQGSITANGAAYAATGSNGLFTLGDTTTRQTDITIKGGLLLGDYANITSAWNSGIYVNYCKNVLIDNVQFNNMKNHGIDVNFTYNFIIQNCFGDNEGDDVITVHENSYGGTIFNNICTNGRSATGGSSGIEIESTAGVSCTITSVATTATVTQTAHQYETNDRITVSGATQTEYNGEYIITRTDADTFTYTFAGSGTSPATGTIVSGAAPSSINITNNIVTGMPLAGIAIVSDAGTISAPWAIDIVGNSVYNSDQNGISTQGDSADHNRSITITGNTVRDSGDGTTSKGGIYALRTDSLTIGNNVITAFDGNGIRVSFCEGVTVNGNVVDECTEYGIIIESDTISCIASENTVRDCGVFAFRAEGTMNGIISNNLLIDTKGTPVMRGFILTTTPANMVIRDNYFDNIASTAMLVQSPGSNVIVKNNTYITGDDFITENSSSATVISTTGTVAHGLHAAPEYINCTIKASSVAPGDVKFTVDATNITATFTGGGTIDFFWEAKSQVQV